jgi:hypothetical protein
MIGHEEWIQRKSMSSSIGYDFLSFKQRAVGQYRLMEKEEAAEARLYKQSYNYWDVKLG